MILIKINVLLLFSFLCVKASSQSRFPTKRWLSICNSSKNWAYNRTTLIEDFLKNNLDNLYS